MKDNFTFKDYFPLLLYFTIFIGLCILTVGPFFAGLLLAVLVNYLFLLIWLVYIPLLPFLVIFWSIFKEVFEE